MAESVKLDFNAIRNISGKTLKQFTVHRVVDICTKALEKAEAAPEIFNFLFTEYIRIMDHGDLDGKLFKFVLPQVLQSIKQNLETNKLDTLLAFLETLTKLTQFMATEVILNNLQILKFEEFIHNSLAILKQLFLAAYSTEQSDLMESTLTYYTAFLDILKSEHVIFFSEDEFSSDGSDKFSKTIVLLLDLSQIFASKGTQSIRHYVNIWQFLVKLFVSNSEQIVENSKAVFVITSNLNSSIRKQVEGFLETGNEALATTINLNLKVLMRFSTVFPNENFKGHENVLQNLVYLKSVQRRNTKFHQTIHQMFVAYMVVLWNIFKSDSMARDLSTLKFNNPEDILSFSEIHLEILKKLTSEPSELSMEKFFPSGQHNYFKTILQHISANSCSFYKRLDLYEELVGQLCGIIILSANSDERFQFMEKLLINTLLEDPKVWIGMLCVDVWIFVARNLHTSQVVRYYRFCRQILDEISSPLSYSTSTIFFEYLLQFFYKMINKGSYKEEKLLDARTKLHLGLEHQASKNDFETLKEEAKREFVVLCEKFVSEDESSSNFDYKEMILSLKLLTSSEITMEEDTARSLNMLIHYASGITELKVFESLLCLLIDVALVASEPSVLNVPEIYTIILKNQINLSFDLKRKVIQLLGKFLAFQDEAILDFHTQLILSFLEDDPDSSILKPMIGEIFFLEEDKKGCQALLERLQSVTNEAKYLSSCLKDGIPNSTDAEILAVMKDIFMADKGKFACKHKCVARTSSMIVDDFQEYWNVNQTNSVTMEETGSPRSYNPKNSIQIKRNSTDDEDYDSFSYSPSATPIRKRQRLEMSVNETLSNFMSYCQCMKNNRKEYKLTTDNRKTIQSIKQILMELENN